MLRVAISHAQGPSLDPEPFGSQKIKNFFFQCVCVFLSWQLFHRVSGRLWYRGAVRLLGFRVVRSVLLARGVSNPVCELTGQSVIA